MATTNKANTVLYIQNKQNSAEKRSGLNLMINMLSQTKNSAGNILLDATVIHIAEFLIITKGKQASYSLTGDSSKIPSDNFAIIFCLV